MRISKSNLNSLVYQVVGAAIEVHTAIGPGLLESVYHKCMKQELFLRGVKFQSESLVPLNYKGLEINAQLRCDLLIENILPVEFKAADLWNPVFEAQLLTYMRLLQLPQGLIINFNVKNIYKEGRKSLVNELYRTID